LHDGTVDEPRCVMNAHRAIRIEGVHEYSSAVPEPPPHALGAVIVEVLVGRIRHCPASPPRGALGAYEGFLHIKKKKKN
jgi:hypothetical protein